MCSQGTGFPFCEASGSLSDQVSSLVLPIGCHRQGRPQVSPFPLRWPPAVFICLQHSESPVVCHLLILNLTIHFGLCGDQYQSPDKVSYENFLPDTQVSAWSTSPKGSSTSVNPLAVLGLVSDRLRLPYSLGWNMHY